MTIREINRERKNICVNLPLFFRFFQGYVSICRGCKSDRIRKIFDLVTYETLKRSIIKVIENERYICCSCGAKGDYKKIVHDEGLF